MKFQFSTSTLLLATACIAVVLTSQLTWFRAIDVPDPIEQMLRLILITVPLWGPLVWIGYAVGRGQLTLPLALSFMAFEAVMTFTAVWAIRNS